MIHHSKTRSSNCLIRKQHELKPQKFTTTTKIIITSKNTAIEWQTSEFTTQLTNLTSKSSGTSRITWKWGIVSPGNKNLQRVWDVEHRLIHHRRYFRDHNRSKRHHLTSSLKIEDRPNRTQRKNNNYVQGSWRSRLRQWRDTQAESGLCEWCRWSKLPALEVMLRAWLCIC